MRKALLLLATMLPLLVAAQGWPASYGGVVLVVDNDTQKNDVINNAATYTKWFDLIFLGNGQTVTSENINTFAAAKTGFIAYFQDLNQATAKNYLDAGYWGYRYRTSSASKANAETTRDINAALNATFVVGDMYGNSTDTNVLKQWLKFNYKDGNYQAAVCDNSLSVQMRDNNDNGEAWNDQGLHSDYIAKHYCLNYVDGATTDIAKKRSMYAFILTRPGTPIVFYGDWNNNSDSHSYVNGYRFLERMIAVRHAVGINNQAAIQGSTGHASGKYYYTVYGTKGSVLVRLGKDYVNQSTPSGYTEVWKDDIDGNNPRFSVYISDNVVDDYNAMLTNSANVRGGDSEPIGFPIIDKASGHYTNSVSVNIKPNNNRTTLVFTTDGTMPTYLSEKVSDATNGRTLTLTKTTTLKVGVIETDGKTVNISNTVVRQYVVDAQSNSSITIYAKRGDQSPAAPVIYATVGGNAVANNVTMSSKKVVGGVEWYYYTFTSASSVRFILKETSNGPETPWLTADRDAFYAFCDHPQSSYKSTAAAYAFDETNTYMVDYYDPKVSIDKASGDYKNWVQPTVSATYKDATIVYTTDDKEPTPDYGTQVTGPTKIISDVFKYDGEDKSVTLRAGVLYNGQVINLVARTYHIKAPEGQSYGSTIGIGDSGIDIFVRRTKDNTNNIYIHYWDDGQGGTWERLTTTKDVGGKTWYYKHFDKTKINFLFNTTNSFPADGNRQTVDMSRTTGQYFFHYNGDYKSTPDNENDTYKPYLSEMVYDNNYVDQGNLIPSCATYVNSGAFFYFENNKPYVSPHAWIFNGYTPISADCWPGSAFIEPIGTSPEGYAIYRWVYDEKTLTAQMNFNDQGGNVVGTSQTNSYNFENSGYYNVSGLQGKVSASYVTLAEAIRYATESQPYYITDDLYVGHISQDGQYIYAKDARGSALNPFYPRADFTLNWDKDDNAYAYDQSNWVEIKLPAEKWIPKTDRNSYIGKTIAGGTLYGTFRSRQNPQIEIATGGMLPVFNPGGYNVTLAQFSREKAYEAFNYNSFRDDSNGVGDLNLYHTGNFLTSVGDIDNTAGDPTIINGDRFYVNPKILEVAAIRWAVYKEKDGRKFFFAPSKNNSAKGGIEIVNDPSSDSDSWWEGGITLQDGKVYLLKGIVINKRDTYHFHSDDHHHNAPRRVNIVSDTASDRYQIRLIDAYTDDRITGVNDVNINKTIESVHYINLMGAESSRAFDGVNIVVTKYSDGTTSTTKVVF